MRRSYPTIDVPDWGERTHIFEGERLSAIHAAIDEVLSSSPPPMPEAARISVAPPLTDRRAFAYLPPSGHAPARVSNGARRAIAATVFSMITIVGVAAAACAVLISI